MKNLFPILLAVVVLSSGCDQDGYSCDGMNCYDDNDNPQYQTLEDCNSMCDEQIPGGCGSPVLHEGYLYSTVQIGDQCWFAENCRYLPQVSPSTNTAASTSDPRYYVYNYQGYSVEEAISTNQYDTYGVLYNWPAVMTNSNSICPSGWHIPTDTDFSQLTDFLGGSQVAGYALKSTFGWDYGGNGSNSSGFNALSVGKRSLNGTGGFSMEGKNAFFWSSNCMTIVASECYNATAYSLSAEFDFFHSSGYGVDDGHSARCIRD